jgi:hypothetical protein
MLRPGLGRRYPRGFDRREVLSDRGRWPGKEARFHPSRVEELKKWVERCATGKDAVDASLLTSRSAARIRQCDGYYMDR